jgi:S1-C subfamily serine protease
MTNDLLSGFSNQLADAVDTASPSVVQVQGRRRPASGLVYADGVVLTTVRALGREDGLHVRRHDGQTFDAELAGWDPTTSLAVLRVAGLDTASAISHSPSRDRGATPSPRVPASCRSLAVRCQPDAAARSIR